MDARDATGSRHEERVNEAAFYDLASLRCAFAGQSSVIFVVFFSGIFCTNTLLLFRRLFCSHLYLAEYTLLL